MLESHRLYLAAILSSLLLVLPLGTQQIEDKRYTKADPSSYSMPSPDYIHEGVSGQIQCAVLCSTAQTCFAYQYNTATQQCYIGEDVSPSGASLDADTRFYMRGKSAQKLGHIKI
ncbi:hypothetical protein PoB_007092300 [Plakobranchus ocellatus]|uniref:Apple domain-containing protein n=1 Tax=Plakobranchus ocellatus TaxID=259542 RepID=A0AAV4DJF7_9GAST|nr:hypothetical protein PoB_007092300 [Plakobranchus ocellatus]